MIHSQSPWSESEHEYYLSPFLNGSIALYFYAEAGYGRCACSLKVTETDEGSLITISVKPRSKKFKIEVQGDEIVVLATEEPTKGKVNKEIMKELSRVFHARVMLVSGFTSKEKKLLICGTGKNDVEKALLYFQDSH